MSKKQPLNLRKTALSKQGAFTPARKGSVVGVGVAKQPAKKSGDK